MRPRAHPRPARLRRPQQRVLDGPSRIPAAPGLVRASQVSAIAAFDQSRLNRSAENDLALLRECVARGFRLILGHLDAEASETRPAS
jgi:hypothetical protein